MAEPTHDPRLRAAIERLAALDRESCSPGEHEAAEWIAAELRELGAAAEVERERVHGTYWWPLGIAAGLGIAGAALAGRGHRLTGAALAAAGAAGVVDDLGAGPRWLRRLLPKRTTANVVAEAGDRDAQETLLLVSHHDAAHTSVFFDPRVAAYLGRNLGDRRGARRRSLPLMVPVAAGPAIVAAAALLGARRLAGAGAFVCAGIAATFTEIALRPTVPGANDNLTGVATILAVARSLREHPVRGLRVLLVSTGSEEALMDGMWAFARRHFPDLDRARTRIVAVDSVGSPRLVLADAEGMLEVRDYDRALNETIAEVAEERGVPLRRGLRMRLGTDGYLALRHGYRAAMLTSTDWHGFASNYHWRTDTPDRVDYDTLAGAVAVCDGLIRRLTSASGEDPAAAPASSATG